MLSFPLFAAFPKGLLHKFSVDLADDRGGNGMPESHGFGAFVERLITQLFLSTLPNTYF